MPVASPLSAMWMATMVIGLLGWLPKRSPDIAIRSCEATVHDRAMKHPEGMEEKSLKVLLNENSAAVKLANSLIREPGWKWNLVSYAPRITLNDPEGNYRITLLRTAIVVSFHLKRPLGKSWVHTIRADQYEALKQAILDDL